MRIRMPVLAAGLIAGTLALGSASVDANPQIALNGFVADSPSTVLLHAPAELIGEMCYIIQSCQLIGGGVLNGGVNSFPVATNGLGHMLIADGPVVLAAVTDVFDETDIEQ